MAYDIMPLNTLNSIVTRNFGRADARRMIPHKRLRKIHSMLNLDRIHRAKGEVSKEAEVVKQLKDILAIASAPKVALYNE